MVTLTDRDIDIEASKYRLKTHEIRRPTRNDAAYASVPDRALALAQAGWDRAKGIDDHLQAHSAAIVVQKAEAEAERRRQQAERDAKVRADADERILAPAWQAFRAAGGSDEEFEKLKPQVLEAARMQAALDAATAATGRMQPRPASFYRG
jgi:hypothetical protein